jgi:2-desacetyl-2-hydroxyethyl bacteriochlorophyllide A dehydrogenase
MAQRAVQVVFTGPKQVELQDVELPALGDYGVLVRTERTLISAGTELTEYLGERSWRPFPRYPGYSNAGIVLEVGRKVAGLQVEERIVCDGGHATHVQLDLSPDRPGGPAMYLKVPGAVSATEATFTTLGAVAVHGVRRGGLQLGEAVAIVGQGVVGQLVAQYCHWSGCQPVIGLDLYQSRLETAKKQSWVDVGLDPRQVDPVKAVAQLTEGRGADAVFEVTRTAKTIPMAMKLARRGGRLVILGSVPDTVELDPFTELQLEELTIVGAHQPKAPENYHHYFPWTQLRNRQTALKFMEVGKLRVGHLVTHELPWREAAEAFRMIAAGGQDLLGVVLTWDS